MLEVFEDLSAEERQLMYDAVPLVTVLIAGADGDIDEEEKAWAEKLTNIRSFQEKGMIQDFYEELGKTFDAKLTNYINKYAGDVEARNAAISAELTKLNAILPKMNYSFAQAYVESLRSFAKHVAKASGGFLGMMSVSEEEDNLMGLSMIKKF